MVHVEAPAATVAPLTEMLPLAAMATTVGAPQPVVVMPGVPPITTPAGKVSVNPSPAKAPVPAVLLMVKVSTEVPLIPMVAGAKALVRTGLLVTARVGLPL